jgi:predicted metal-binding membrane protein
MPIAAVVPDATVAARLGCCAMLMALLFVFGVMNLAWVGLLAIVVLIEKVAPGGRLIGRFAGVAALAVGVAMAFGLPTTLSGASG